MADAPSQPSVMEQIVSLCKRRGFVYPASEIYGGLNGFWDYGPLGVLLKNNVRDWWWRQTVLAPPIGPDGHPIEIVGLDSSIIQNPKTWVASGHAGGFSDPMVDDRETKQRYRADHLLCAAARVKRKDGRVDELGLVAVLSGDNALADFEKRVDKMARRTGGGQVLVPERSELVPFTALDRAAQEKVLGPDATQPGTLTEPRDFNLMFQTYVGAIQDDSAKAYLRPETAQGIFLNYKNVLDTMRVKVPFGVAQVGKSFRNEVTPRNFIFRSREFEQMELEWFCHPDEARKWFDFWVAERMRWWRSLGISESNLRVRQHEQDELSHYAKAGVGTADIEYKYPFTAPDFGELEGIAHRTDFDLKQHEKHSGQRLDYFDQDLQVELKGQGVADEEIKRRSRYYPHVIEPASGLTRAVLVLLCEGFTVDESRPSKMYMRFDPKFAPIKCGIFPLVNKDGMPEIAEKLYLDLRNHFTCEYDVKQTVGKRYARMDEIGTPFCVTVDGQTKEEQTVTIRDRDTMSQQRVALDKVLPYLRERLGS
jgi:glycyl-tRNA synthetase